MIRKLWVKFDGMDVDCVCDEHHRKCKDKSCKEYVVKFTEIKRSETDKQLNELKRDLFEGGKLIEKATKQLNKQTTELRKSIKKFKI